MKIFRIFIALLLGSSLTAVNAQNRLTAESLVNMERVSDPAISPDGSKVVYRVAKADVAANRSFGVLYIQSTAGGAPVKLTEESDNAFSPQWRPDGKVIGFLSMVDGAPQLFEISPTGSDKKRLTALPGGMSNFKYSPDMRHVMFTQDVKIERTVQEMYPNLKLDKVKAVVTDGLDYRHWDTWNDEQYSHVFFISYADLSTGEGPQDIMPGEKFDSPLMPFGGSEQLAWSHDSKKIVYTSKKLNGKDYAVSTNSDLYQYNIENGENLNLTERNPGYDINPAFSVDGKLAYLSMQTAGYESDKNRLMLYDFDANSARDLTDGWDQTVESFEWAPDGKTIYLISGINATKQIYACDVTAPKGKNIKQITKGWHDYTALSVGGTAKNHIVVGTKMSISSPSALYAVSVANGSEMQLSVANKDALGKIKMGQVRQRMVTSADGKKVLTWVIYPPDFDSTKKYPALLYAQGGPQSAVSQFFSSRWNFQLMAAHGYIVVAPNRRGLPTFGQEWNDAIVGDYGGMPMQDLLSAIDDVAKEPYVDKNRLGAVGASFGGFTVYWLAGHNENKRFKTFVAHAGMFNMESWYGSTEEMFFANNDQKGPYWENPTPYDKFSPHNFVKNWNTPILIIHNEKDFRVPVTQGMEAFTAAQMKGIESKFLYFPDENHWVLKPQNSLLWQAVFYDWLDKHLK